MKNDTSFAILLIILLGLGLMILGFNVSTQEDTIRKQQVLIDSLDRKINEIGQIQTDLEEELGQIQIELNP